MKSAAHFLLTIGTAAKLTFGGLGDAKAQENRRPYYHNSKKECRHLSQQNNITKAAFNFFDELTAPQIAQVPPITFVHRTLGWDKDQGLSIHALGLGAQYNFSNTLSLEGGFGMRNPILNSSDDVHEEGHTGYLGVSATAGFRWLGAGIHTGITQTTTQSDINQRQTQLSPYLAPSIRLGKQNALHAVFQFNITNSSITGQTHTPLFEARIHMPVNASSSCTRRRLSYE